MWDNSRGASVPQTGWIYSAVLIQYWCVTDRQTDGHRVTALAHGRVRNDSVMKMLQGAIQSSSFTCCIELCGQ